MVALGQNGHPDMTMAKRLITTRLWFLDMDAMVKRRVGDCQAPGRYLGDQEGLYQKSHGRSLQQTTGDQGIASTFWWWWTG